MSPRRICWESKSHTTQRAVCETWRRYFDYFKAYLSRKVVEFKTARIRFRSRVLNLSFALLRYSVFGPRHEGSLIGIVRIVARAAFIECAKCAASFVYYCSNQYSKATKMNSRETDPLLAGKHKNIKYINKSQQLQVNDMLIWLSCKQIVD